MWRPAPRDSGERLERQFQDERDPIVPAMDHGRMQRWVDALSWTPAETLLLCRHRRVGGEERVVTNSRRPPRGFELEYDLGCVHEFQLPGTAELIARGPQGFEVVPDPGDGTSSIPGPRSPETLGYVGEHRLPLLELLEIGFHEASGQWLLVSGDEDALREELGDVRPLGFVEAFPTLPRIPRSTHRIGLRPLLRTVDAAAFRHRVRAGEAPPGELSLELGAMHEEPQEGSIPIWIVDDRVVVGEAPPAPGAPSRSASLRWAAAPLSWRDLADQPLKRRAGLSARRLRAAAAATSDPGPQPGEPPAGYLWADPDGDFRQLLYVATHPVTGDQLVTPWPNEASDLGYGAATPIGWSARVAPATGSLGPRPVPIPWASRLGVTARRYL